MEVKILFYTIYCNEQMVADHPERYDECNSRLRNILARSDFSTEQCADIYLSNMTIKSCRPPREKLVSMFDDKKKSSRKLLAVNKIDIYQSDIDYIVNACREYGINRLQRKVLFGIIFMARLHGSDTVDLCTEYQIKGFCGCFHDRHLYNVVSGETWDKTFCEPAGLDALCECDLLIRGNTRRNRTYNVGIKYIYPNYDCENREVAFTYYVTDETNKLDLETVVEQIGLNDLKFCSECGKAYYEESCKRKYCKKCAVVSKNNTNRKFMANKRKCG